MPLSHRAAWALGLGLLGAVALVAPSSAQNPAADAGVKRTNTQAPAAAPKPAIIGCVDMNAIFKGYDRVKDTTEQLRTDIMAKQGELAKLQTDIQKITEKMKGFQPGTSDFKKFEAEYTKLKVQLEADGQQAEHDFTQREAASLAELYTEVQGIVARVAQYKGMTYVVQVSNDKVDGNEPKSVMAAMARSVVYADPANDITGTVLATLNTYYKQRKPATPAAARPAAEQPAPIANPAPAAGNGAAPRGN